MIEQRTFGKTGLKVGVLGFGAAELGFDPVSDKKTDELLGIAADSGINVIDTAAMYADSEEKLGRALRLRPGRFLIFSKCGRSLPPRFHPSGFRIRVDWTVKKLTRKLRPDESSDWDARALKMNVEQSLRRLGTPCIDVMQLHTCSEDTLRRGEVIEVLERERDAGKIRYIGYTGDNSAAAYAVECGRFDSVQTSVNIADQRVLDDTLRLAAQQNVGVVAKRPIANALWTKKDRPEAAHLKEYWERFQRLRYPFLLGPNAHEIALRFTLTSPIHTAIVGTTNPSHLRQNVQHAASGALTQEEYLGIRERWKQVAIPSWIGQM
jgi:aryl-alcohol dehydrogenase-like predicted oxidoreductase